MFQLILDRIFRKYWLVSYIKDQALRSKIISYHSLIEALHMGGILKESIVSINRITKDDYEYAINLDYVTRD